MANVTQPQPWSTSWPQARYHWPMSTTRSVFASTDALAAELVDQTIVAAEEAIAARGIFTMALTGGSVVSAVYPVLAQAALPWDKVHIFFGDERAVPPDDKESNYKLAVDTLLGHPNVTAAHVHRIRGEDDPATAAVDAETVLLEVTGGSGALDVVHVGMGPDGHVCSLFPGHALLNEQHRLVMPIFDSPKPPSSRVTFTLQALATARQLFFLVTGAAKADAVAEAILQPQSMLPVALAARRAQTARWFLDADAARHLK